MTDETMKAIMAQLQLATSTQKLDEMIIDLGINHRFDWHHMNGEEVSWYQYVKIVDCIQKTRRALNGKHFITFPPI